MDNTDRLWIETEEPLTCPSENQDSGHWAPRVDGAPRSIIPWMSGYSLCVTLLTQLALQLSLLLIREKNS